MRRTKVLVNGKVGREEAKKDPSLATSKFARGTTQDYLSALSPRDPPALIGHALIMADK